MVFTTSFTPTEELVEYIKNDDCDCDTCGMHLLPPSIWLDLPSLWYIFWHSSLEMYFGRLSLILWSRSRRWLIGKPSPHEGGKPGTIDLFSSVSLEKIEVDWFALLATWPSNLAFMPIQQDLCWCLYSSFHEIYNSMFPFNLSHVEVYPFSWARFLTPSPTFITHVPWITSLASSCCGEKVI